MTDVERITTAEAHRLVQEEGYLFIDVRTPEEFDAGHPVGARNVPVSLRVDGRMTPNEAFVGVMEAVFGTEAKLVLGCAAGRRSLTAARLLVERGFGDVVEMRAGYNGVRDPFGQVTEKGWAAASLPTELVTDGGDYATLLAKGTPAGE